MKSRLLTSHASGPTVVCLDGVAGAWPDWLAVAERLEAQASVLVVERGRPFPYALGDAARDVISCLDEYAVGSAVVVGHSMGGFAAEATARLFPDRVAALGLIDSSVAARGMGTGPLARVEEAVAQLAWNAVNLVEDRGWWPAVGPKLRRQTEPARRRWWRPRRRNTDELAAKVGFWRRSVKDLRAYPRWGRELWHLRVDHPLRVRALTMITALRKEEGVQPSWSWQSQQLALASKLRREVPTMRHEFIIGAPHNVHMTNPREIADEVRRLFAFAG